jgi:arylformamidase
MRIQIKFNNENYKADLHAAIDLSIPLEAGPGHVTAWYVEPIQIEPVRMGEWVGEVKQGAAVNFRNIFFNPHGHGTHTECVGHISPEIFSVNKCLKNYFCFAQVISVTPDKINEDEVITLASLEQQLIPGVDALVMRTLPNSSDKMTRQYSSTNPPYLDSAAATFIAKHGIKHLLLDLPSVDRENDGGKLLAHHAFWNYPENTRFDATITEMIYVPDNVADGMYLLNLQVAPFENDASPSRPVLFAITKINS